MRGLFAVSVVWKSFTALGGLGLKAISQKPRGFLRSAQSSPGHPMLLWPSIGRILQLQIVSQRRLIWFACDFLYESRDSVTWQSSGKFLNQHPTTIQIDLKM